MYCLAAGVVGLGYGFGTMIPVSVVIERWFIQKRTIAVGICSSVTGLASLGVPTLLTRLVETLGLRRTFFAEGWAVAALVLVSALLIRSRPADMGRTPYGAWEEMETPERLRRSGRLPGHSWLLMVPVLLCIGGFTSVGYSHITVLARGEGFSPDQIALAVTVSGIALMLGKFGYGWLSEKWGAYRSNWLFGALLTAGLFLCCVTGGSRGLLYLSMVLFGLGLALGTVGLTAWAGDLSGPEAYDDTIRRFQVGYAAGGLVFSGLPGLMADRSGGSYVPAYLLFLGASVFVLFSIQRIYRRYRITAPQEGRDSESK